MKRASSGQLVVHRALSRAILTALISISASGPASAQFESFLGSITDVQISASCWFTGSDIRTSCSENPGYGFEVLWNLKTIPWLDRGTTPPSLTLVRVEKYYRTLDDGTGVVDSTLTFEPRPARDTARVNVLIELALGYSQFSGFRATDPSLDLRGTVRELPALSVYGTIVGWPLQIFGGMRSGLIQLYNVQIIDGTGNGAAFAYTASAQAFQIGVVGGLVRSLSPHLHVIAESAYHVRRFPSVHWGAAVPMHFPRSFDFSGPSLTLGLQVSIRTPR